MSNAALPAYTVHAAERPPGLNDGWDHPAWARAGTVAVDNFHPEGSDHRPRTQARLLHGGGGIQGIFRIDDRYIRAVRSSYGSQVWKDSCVEFFVQPRPDRGYFNLEMNAGGSHLCNYIEDPTRTPDGFKKYTPLPPEIGGRIQVRSSLPATVEPEVTEPLIWELNFFFPFAVMGHFLGPMGPISGQSWRGNLYKCGDETSHPHWAAWSPVDQLNFHLPRCFGILNFE